MLLQIPLGLCLNLPHDCICGHTKIQSVSTTNTGDVLVPWADQFTSVSVVTLALSAAS